MEIPNARAEAADAELDGALARAIRRLIAEATDAEAAAAGGGTSGT